MNEEGQPKQTLAMQLELAKRLAPRQALSYTLSADELQRLKEGCMNDAEAAAVMDTFIERGFLSHDGLEGIAPAIGWALDAGISDDIQNKAIEKRVNALRARLRAQEA